jgi:arylsulfatase A-like enzyme
MPHLPISTSDEFKGISEAGLYGDVIQTLDWSMGELFKTLESNNIENNTLVVFTSDNGPWHNLPDRMLQRGVKDWHTGSSGPLRGAKATSYEGGHRVPAIIRWPGQVPEDIESNQVMTTMDLFATIVDVCGAELPSDRKIDGKSALKMIKGEGDFNSEIFFYLSGNNLHAVRDGEWKLRVTKEAGVELYNLYLDHSEKYNRAEGLPEVVEELYQNMKVFSKETGAKLVDW